MPYVRDGYQQQARVESIKQAQGVRFLCPKCYEANGGPVGTHAVICWSPAVPDRFDPKPGRWVLLGTGFDDLTLGPPPGRSASVLLTSRGGCQAHFFVENGAVRMC